MIKNLLKIAVRNLLKSKTFSLINIVGLAFGLCCALLISLWIIDEYSIDNYHSKKDRIYQVVSELKSTNGSTFWSSSPGPLSDVLKNDIAGIEEASRFTRNRLLLFKNESGNLEESGINADPELLKIFDFPLLEGDAETALDDPHSLVISKKLADKLFPNTSALDKTVVIGDWGEDVSYRITGVLDEIPDQSTLQFEYIRPFETYLENRPWNMSWGNYNDRTVFLASDGVDISEISKQILGFEPEEFEEFSTAFHFYPFKDIYLQSDFSNGIDAEGRIVYVRVFSIIAILLMLVACINFMNLSTARAGKRAKEVGVRKTTGASRESLVFQFLGESVLIALISGALAITMTDILLLFFNELTDKSLSIPYGSPLFMLSLAMICTVTGVLAGIYPALHLSGFNPSQVLKSAVNNGGSLSGFRRVLVVVQFSLSITFVVTTMIVYNQMQFIMNKDLGLEKENILHHDMNGIMESPQAYRSELLKIPGVRTATQTNSSPLSIGNSSWNVGWEGKEEGEDIFFHIIQTDQFFVETFKAQLLEGRGFYGDYDSTSKQVLINEEAVNVMYLENPAGSKINVWGDEVEVVGVIKDFHHQNLSQKIDPIIVYYNPGQAWQNYIAIDGDVNQILGKIEETYNKFEKSYPFDYGFVDQDFEKMYSRVSIIGSLSNIFAFVTIFVSCLGLFGLASYMTEQRKKETGIRKVMGASVPGLVVMFTKNFLKLIAVSFLISAPIAWYLASQWLEGFAFKIDVDIQPFIIGGLSAAVIAVATVSYHTIRVATANPIDSLKYE